MVKRVFLLSIIFVLSVFYSVDIFSQTISETLSVQNPVSFAEKIGYINSKDILDSIPEKVKAAKVIEDLNQRYKDELGTMQADYNRKYSDFMTYQNSMTENIKLRRMQELYELEKSISQFMQIAQEDIESQEQQQIEPLRQKVKEAINQVGLENDFICIFDLANPSVSFVTPKAVNITPLVKRKLGIKISGAIKH
ncbi:OmpH family outer membrane protein [Dysgonomonas sp. 520]|uniref:OmpH family outer membrane protein n=1 Tax=Dysgonomonas sp. 520 TaxID=2302931 RepID=UPI0013D2D989|nr:OmpH family outer membrane protein [Dysgonomonas sp. 520]NDW10490.1 OmpH family outer membrane protein [Dysgonomonas sp. 520]